MISESVQEKQDRIERPKNTRISIEERVEVFPSAPVTSEHSEIPGRQKRDWIYLRGPIFEQHNGATGFSLRIYALSLNLSRIIIFLDFIATSY